MIKFQNHQHQYQKLMILQENLISNLIKFNQVTIPTSIIKFSTIINTFSKEANKAAHKLDSNKITTQIKEIFMKLHLHKVK